MSESRDRLIRAVDIAALYALRRLNPMGIYVDQPELEQALFGPFHALTHTQRQPQRVGLGLGLALGPSSGNADRGSLSNRENVPPGASASRRGINRRGRGRGGYAPRSILPAWYPRTPLRDITHVVRAIERRRERLEGGEGQETEGPWPNISQDPDSFATPSVARLKHTRSTKMTPLTKSVTKQCPPSMIKVQKLLHDFTKRNAGDPEFLTPQKKLLNAIDTVEKVVSEEISKLKRTPSAKKAEREKRVRTLMSMR